jgi:hypothetical protein
MGLLSLSAAKHGSLLSMVISKIVRGTVEDGGHTISRGEVCLVCNGVRSV